MAELERIKPVVNIARDKKLERAAPGPRPRLEWLPLSALVVDRSYQRDLNKRSMTVIRNMVARFDWAAMKALTVVEAGAGIYEVIDGQHTATAAATHGGIDELPCVICPARPHADKARAFMEVNKNRVPLIPLQVFWAEVNAGDDVALAALDGVKAAGGRVRRFYAAPGVECAPGDVLATGVLKQIATKKGKAGVARIMRLAMAAGGTPVPATLLRALEGILWPPHERAMPSTADEAIAALLHEHWDELDGAAGTRRELHRVSYYKALRHEIQARLERGLAA